MAVVWVATLTMTGVRSQRLRSKKMLMIRPSAAAINRSRCSASLHNAVIGWPGTGIPGSHNRERALCELPERSNISLASSFWQPQR